MKSVLSFLLIGFCFVQAQVTLIVNSIPANTPEGSDIYVAGSFNGWNPGLEDYKLNLEDGVYSIILPEGSGTAEYKFTRGDWATVEGNAEGYDINNRTFSYTGSGQVIEHQILSWRDLGPQGPSSTAAWNVSVMDEDFYMPQLNKNRRIWLYLPPDYESSTKTYPVLYMQDGQNLFDNATAFAGEWEVDETLNNLFENGDYGVIVVGIDNGGADRIEEYSPWNNPEYGGGDGDAYLQFMTETLKPYIDSHYRTRPQAQYNALIGSSLGALISTYGVVSRPDVYGKLGSMSPAFWFAYSDLNQFISNTTNDLSNLKAYYVASENESETMVPYMNEVRDLMVANGVNSNRTLVKADDYGGHNENYWKGEFEALYLWLFQGENLGVLQWNQPKVQYHINGNQLLVKGLEENTKAQIYNAQGQLLGTFQMKNGWNDLPQNLNSGVFFLKSENFSWRLLKK